MATTKILQIKKAHSDALTYIMDINKTSRSHEQDALTYIADGHKTNDGELVTGYNCFPTFSSVEFALTQEMAREVYGNYQKGVGNEIKAYHLIQSFSPDDNVTPQEAHEIGQKMMQELLGGKYEYVIATHIDKAHIHNHVVFNATSFYDYKKFRCKPYTTAAQIRSISDKLCAEKGLHVIEQNQSLKSNRTNYQKYRAQASFRMKIRKRLSYLLETETDVTSFKEKARALGVTVDFSGQHATYQFEGQQRKTRDNKLSDVGNFSEEGVQLKLEQNKRLISFVEEAIIEACHSETTLEDFLAVLSEKGITTKRNRQGKLSYSIQNIDNSHLVERALNPGYQIDKITAYFKEQRPLTREEDNNNIVESFEEDITEYDQDDEIGVLLTDELIHTKTEKGLLIHAANAHGERGLVFVDAKQIDYVKSKNRYRIHLGSRFNYYFMEEGKQTNYFLKGETFLRQLETRMNVPTKEVSVPMENVVSLTEKGVTLKFPNHHIKRLFLPKEAVTLDPLTQTLKVTLSDNWHYNFQKDSFSPEGVPPKKMPSVTVTGEHLVKIIQSSSPNNASALAYRLQYFKKKEALQEVKDYATKLNLLRHHAIKDLPHLETKLNDLKGQIEATQNHLTTLETKVVEYQEIAKYLHAYQSNLDLVRMTRYSQAGHVLPKEEQAKLETALYAEKKLEEKQIEKSIDSEKVLALVVANKEQLAQLKETFTSQQKEFTNFQEVHDLMTCLPSESKRSLAKPKDKKKEQER